MTNKMPVVGKRYKTMPQFSRPYIIEVIAITNKWIVAKTNKYFSFENEVIENFLLDGWEKEFEELPEDNLQETEGARVGENQLPEIGSFYRRFDSTGAWECQDLYIERTPNGKRFARMWATDAKKPEEFDLKKGFWKHFELIPYGTPLPERNKGNETPNPVDLEKGEVNEVERALERFKLAINSVEARAMTGETGIVEKVLSRAHALEAEKNERPLINNYHDTNCTCCGIKLGPIACKSSFKLGIFCSVKCGDMSKPEPKIDIQKPSVEPVSIWKDVSELPKQLEHHLIKFDDA